MKFSLTYIPLRLFPVIVLCVMYALLQTAAFRPIVSFPFGLLLLKSCIDAIILLGMGILLAVIIPSSNYVRLDVFQRFINYFALGFLYVSIWALFGYLSSILLLSNENRDEIRSLIPLSAFIGLFMYVIHVQMIHFRMVQKEAEKERQKEEEQETDSAEPHPDKEKENNKEGEILERVAVKIGQKIHVILVPDIVYIRSDGDYVQIVTAQNRFLKEETMKYFEVGLPSSQFVRVHRSYIVNVEKILRIETYEKQSQMLTLKNGDKIRASVAGYKALRTVLNL
ncbi:LytTR family DNA-binding domain-containing protein [uncultured Proteiniphilum sp.]|uniref:LytR/AlgR family response regulator transcription factor n=1 Tax=uncultured Proteiniphilum sp. TaxID=497637 RepID=UPI002625376A|nr:LytTR family DNA-binding domain-containing protein [uncultured Proteiniphilum sp.]